MKPTFETSLGIPPHVASAAQTIHDYFALQGTDSWELMGICSRDRLAKLEQALREIRSRSPVVFEREARRIAEIADKALHEGR